MPHGKITTVLLDLDGTLLDSNEAHAKAWVLALAEFHIRVEYDKVRCLIGMGSDQLLPTLTDIDPKSSKAEKIAERRGEIFRSQYLADLKPFPKARELVEKLITVGLKPVVATSSSEEDKQKILQQIGIKDLITKSTSADDVEKSKPSPDIILAALEKARAKPHEAIMLGDTPYDIQAAAKAGVQTIALTCGGWTISALQEAVAVYRDPAELLEYFEQSIFYINS